ncbi:hypothetical protein GW796_06450 [archaeon]|nr:hypothetical protein [archaeon]
MKKNENEVLNKVFWPKGQEKILGNLFFNFTNEEMTETKTIGVSRSQKNLEVFYSVADTFSPEKKEYFVKLIFERNDDDLILVATKSSPEIKTKKDIDDVLESLQNSILKMSVNPQFFATGVIERNTNIIKP